jgi:hypothetical protein
MHKIEKQYLRGGNVKERILSKTKQIIQTQILSIIFAIVGEVYIRLLIAHQWIFCNFILINLGIVLLALVYIVAVRVFLEGHWLNVLLISFSYVVYWFIILIVGSKVFSTHTDPNDYVVGIIGIVTSFYQWISVIIASIIGTDLNRRSVRKNGVYPL